LASVTFERVLVPDERALGDPGNAASASGITRALQEATIGLALETVGTSDALFQLVLAYVKDRKQFGVPIGSFQAVKHKMANLFLAVERARALCSFAVAAIEEDTPTRATAVSMAKAASDDCQRLVCRDAFQSFGGIGFTWEHDAHLYIKRAETSGALFGGAAAHSLAVAASLGAGRAGD
jgi:alkylation response protein AidB-like acyl-CoA dehydrogenase